MTRLRHWGGGLRWHWSRCDHQRRQYRPEFGDDGQSDYSPDKDLRAELRQEETKLEGHDHAREHRRKVDNGQRTDADLVELADDGRPPGRREDRGGQRASE